MTSSSIVYVVGGKARKTKERLEEWEWFDEARVVRVDCDTGEAECIIRHVTPPDRRPDESPSIVFKAGARVGNSLHLCTQTEVLEYDLRSHQLKNEISLPFFNDLHHVQPLANGNLAVVVTGLDLVVEITRGGEVVREWPALEEAAFARFSRDVDYRKVATTKPHLAHPNYAFEYDGSLWTTRLHQRDAIRLDDPKQRLEIGGDPPHDGRVLGDSVYFTTIRGQLIVLHGSSSGNVRRDVYSIPEILDTGSALGWCRGLKLLDGGRIALIGFTRLRKTKIRRNLEWAKVRLRHGLSKRAGLDVTLAGTMFMMVDLEKRQILRHFDVERFGLNAIFSIHGDCGAETAV